METDGVVETDAGWRMVMVRLHSFRVMIVSCGCRGTRWKTALGKKPTFYNYVLNATLTHPIMRPYGFPGIRYSRDVKVQPNHRHKLYFRQLETCDVIRFKFISCLKNWL